MNSDVDSARFYIGIRSPTQAKTMDTTPHQSTSKNSLSALRGAQYWTA